ncbi:MAG: GFA family protein [Pseudomonadota bacterium]
MEDKIEGGCLCGTVRYRITERPLSIVNCHCRSCRLGAGVAGVAWVTVAKNVIAVSSGTPVQFQSSPHVTRTFCGKCGTSLTYEHDDDPGTIDVTTASLDHPDRFAPQREVWLEDRLAWEALDDNIPHFSRGSGDAAGKASG